MRNSGVCEVKRERGERGGKKGGTYSKREKYEISGEEMERIKRGRKLVYCLSAIIPSHTHTRTHTHTHTHTLSQRRVKLWSCSWPGSLFELARLIEAHLLIGRCARPEGLVGLGSPPDYSPLTHLTQKHTHSKSSLPPSFPPSLLPFPPLPFPKLLLEEERERVRSEETAGRRDAPSHPARRASHTHKHTVRAGVVEKAWSFCWQLSSSWYCNLYFPPVFLLELCLMIILYFNL